MTPQPSLLATSPATSTSSIAPRLAWGLFGFSLLFSLAGLGLLALSYNTPINPGWGFRGFAALFALAFSTVGALITSRQPRNPIGWIFGLSGLASSLLLFLQEYAIYTLLTAPGSLPGGIAAAWVQNWIWVWAALPLWVFLPLTFPHGRLPSPRWRPVAWLAGISILVATVGFAFDPEPIENLELNNPLTFPGAHLVGLIATLSISLIGLAAAVSLFQRLRHTRGEERQQLKWFFYAATLLVVTIPFAAFDETSILVIIATLGIPIATGIAILKYRLYDIDLIIRRTLLYGPITVLGFLLYLITVGGASLFLQTQNNLVAALIALAIVATFFVPVRRRLQSFLDRFIPLPSHPKIEEAVVPPVTSQLATYKLLSPVSSRRVRSLAWGLWTIAILLMLATLFLFYLNWTTPVPASWSVEAGLRNNLSTLLNKIVGLMIYTVLTTTIGVIVAVRRPQNPIGWLLCLAGCASGLIEMEQEYTIYANFTAPGSAPGGSIAALIMNWLWVTIFTLFFWMMAIFPEGRLLSPRWRWLFWVNAVFTVSVIISGLIEQPMHSAFNLDNPLPVSGLGMWFTLIFSLAMLVLIIIVVGITVLMASRFREAQGDERQQLKWLAGAALLTALCLIIGLGLTFLLHIAAAQLLVSASLIFVPIGIGVAILRYRLYDIDLIIRRTLVYGALTMVGFGSYLLAIGGMSLFLQSENNLAAIITALLVVTVLFFTLRPRLQALADRFFPLPPRPVASESASGVHFASLPVGSANQGQGELTLSGPWLYLAHTLWVSLTLLIFGLWVMATFIVNPVTLEEVSFGVLMPLSFFAMAVFIFSRKSNEVMGLLVSLMLVLFGPYLLIGLGSALGEHEGWKFLNAFLEPFSASVTLICFCLFPDGRFVPRWLRWLVLGSISGMFIASFANLFFPLEGWPIIFFISMVLCIIAQGYRYLRVSSPLQRQQAKWVVLGFLGPLLGGLWWFFVLVPIETVLLESPALILINLFFMTLLALLLPLSIVFSILRYRLYDIDLIIRRTLIYGVITGVGFGVYFFAVGGTSLFLQSQNKLVAAIIALSVMVVLFFSLRPRLQALVDQRFPLPARPAVPEPALEIPHPPLPAEEIGNESQVALTLSGWRLNLARTLWLFLALLVFGSWVVATFILVPVTLEEASFRVLMPLSFFAMAAFIFWRKSNEVMGLLVSFMLVFFGPYLLSGVSLTLGEHESWKFLNAFLEPVGASMTLICLYVFPNGQFVPRWMRWLVLVSIFGMSVPMPEVDWPLGFLLFGTSIVIGLISQGYRYFYVSSPLQRQQTKWVIMGFLGPTLGFFWWLFVLTPFEAILLNSPALVLLNSLFVTMLISLLPLSLAFSILRYRLYDIDLIIRRTVVYGALIGGLALAYFGGVAVLQFLSQAFTGPQSDLVVVAITLAIAALFNPVRRQFQDFIDRRFYREKVDFRQAFTAFARDVRTLIDLPELLRVLVTRTTDLLHINHGAVFLVAGLEGLEAQEGEGEFRLAEGRNLPPGVESLVLNYETAERLREGHPVSQPKDKIFPLFIPLMASMAQNLSNSQVEGKSEILIGVLALGPRLSEQDYSREDQTLLLSLADQAGTAIYVAQLIQEKQAEALRREESERQLEAYRHSPMGRAETLAQALIGQPETALIELHNLAQNAEHDLDIADLLEHLTRALGYLGANILTGFADGYHFIFNSQSAPELLPVGLRLLIDHLSLPAAADIQGTGQALPLYRLCQQALEANAISQITQLLPDLQAQERNQEAQAFPSGLAGALSELTTSAEALHAYERVDMPQDKLAYLASAVERLSHLDRLARTELGSADRPIIQRIAAGWLALVTGAMSDLQTRARLTCQLLTRHTWVGEIITLAFSLRNEGRGAALNLKISLVPAPEYTLVDETGQIERLSAGEERQVELRVRPRLAQGISQFRARFIILYDDPRGPDQIEHFADVVYLLADEGEFKFIPNPYVVGTPLQTGSSLFFGREDVIAFIQENLMAAHQNNLVLIGQRRTGKTSLLKQLPAHLGDRYVPVYLDGQSLALDPGLPSFFFSLATEITFALEDQGLGGASTSPEGFPPDFEEFTDSPAATFERKFLAKVRDLIGDRHLLLLLDEFEELEAAVRRGNIDASIFGFLRHLIQHTGNLSVIFCGTHRLEELAADYWSVLFNISLYRHVAFLNQAEAVRLVQEPVAPYGMRYDDLALDKMWRVTAGHPYFLQLLCHSLVNRHNKTGRNYVTVADVNAALDEMLASGEAHFVFLWTESSHDERLVLTALSRMMPLTGQVKPAQVTDYLVERGASLDRRAVSAALHHLALRDILQANITEEASADTVEAYRWQLGLLGLWVEKYKSLSRVVEERNA